jgi:hypothetical protein
MSQQPRKTGPQETVDAARRGYEVGGGYGAVIAAIGANAGAIYRALGGGGTRDLKQWERQQLYDAGFRKVGPNRWEKVNTATGNVDTIKNRKQAIKAAKELRFIGSFPPIPPGHDASLPPLIAIPGGASAVDVLGRIPGYGSAAARGLGLGIAGLLLWPREAGRGSDLRDYWMKNAKPATGPRTRGGRRGRARAKGRRGRRPRAVAKPKVPVTWPGRGGPVTISRGRVVTPPAVAIRTGKYSTNVLPPSWETDTAGEPGTTGRSSSTSSSSTSSSSALPTSSASSPAVPKVPVAAPGATVWSKLGLPTSWAGAMQLVTPYLLANAFAPQPSRAPKFAPQVAPAPQLGPLTASNVAPLAYAPARARDCSCARTKSRRKQTCRNPVTKRKRETRGGHRFVTTTKRLDCQRGKQT